MDGEVLEHLSRHVTNLILDSGMSVEDIVKQEITRTLNFSKECEEKIITDITTTLENYKTAPSEPMIYR